MMIPNGSSLFEKMVQLPKRMSTLIHSLRFTSDTKISSDLWNFVPWSEDCTVKLGTRTNGISLLNFRTFEREIQQATRSLIEIDENFSIISTKPAEKGTKRKAKGEQKTTTT